MSSALSVATGLTDAEVVDRAVLSTVAYSDVFEYPLQASEVHRYLHGINATLEMTAAALARCSGPGRQLSRVHDYYTLRGRERLVDARRARALRAQRLWPTAVRFGRAIGCLPFVRMVAVTGSLAWDNPDDSADIDYLIVTEPDRLWTCRWLVGAVVRAARLEGVQLCPNYVVSRRALRLAEQNLYGAYELARMTPVVGLTMYRRLRRANPWAAAYLPNAIETPRLPEGSPVASRGIRAKLTSYLKHLGERVLRARPATLLERYEMRYRIRKRLKQYAAQAESSYGLDWYKSHTSGHRGRALAAFTERLGRLQEKA
jgi:hypothetical protein